MTRMRAEKTPFEHTIGSLLVDFSAVPSIGVFEEVQRRLTRRRKKRFLLLLLLIGIASAPVAIRISRTGLPVETVTVNPGARTVAEDKTTTARDGAASTALRNHQSHGSTSANGVTPSLNARQLPVYNDRKTGNSTAGRADVSIQPATNKNDLITPGFTTSPETDTSSRIIQTVERLHMHVMDLPLVVIENDIANADSLEWIENKSVMNLKRASKSRLFLGVFYSPQLTGQQFSRNPNAGEAFRDGVDGFEASYLADRRKDDKLQTGFAAGIKGGMVGAKWESLFGIGFQRIVFDEVQTKTSGPVVMFLNPMAFAADPVDPLIYRHKLRYALASIEVSRLISTRWGRTIKFGAGLSAQFLLNRSVLTMVAPGNYAFTTDGMNRLQIVPSLKAGLVEHITQRLQLQVCPVIFMSANSLYRSDHIIRQRTFGAGLEFGLYFQTGR